MSQEWLRSISTRQTALKKGWRSTYHTYPCSSHGELGWYAYEPRRNYVPAVVPDDVVVSEDTNIVDGSDRLNNTECCTCDNVKER